MSDRGAEECYSSTTMFTRFAAALLLFGLDGGAPVPRITSKNWEHHPHVASARTVYAEVRASLDAKRLVTRDLQDCTQEFSSFTVATDDKGVVRLLVRDFGSDDSSHRAETYYDAAGKLRFVFVRVGAVPSAWVEARFWLDEKGALVWKTRAVGGEGPQYYANEPKEYLVRDPTAFVQERTRCLDR